MSDPPAAPSWLLAGRVGRPHGLDGSFHVVDPSPQLLAVGATVRVGDRDVGIAWRAGTEQRPIVRLEGCERREQAEALRGEELLVERAHAPELEADEWWAEDLEGCSVVCEGRTVGTVLRLRALPSCEVLEVARAGSGGELLVPLVRDAVRSVDLDRREIEVDLLFLGEEE
jgi:16S rRNA processing protein RimM